MGREANEDTDARAGDAPRAVTGAGTDHAAFHVGVLAGAALGGVGGALVGDETAAGKDGDRPDARPDGADHRAAEGDR